MLEEQLDDVKRVKNIYRFPFEIYVRQEGEEFNGIFLPDFNRKFEHYHNAGLLTDFHGKIQMSTDGTVVLDFHEKCSLDFHQMSMSALENVVAESGRLIVQSLKPLRRSYLQSLLSHLENSKTNLGELEPNDPLIEYLRSLNKQFKKDQSYFGRVYLKVPCSELNGIEIVTKVVPVGLYGLIARA